MTDPLSAAERVAQEINRVLREKPRALGDHPKLRAMLQDIETLDQNFKQTGGVFFHTGSSAFETAERFTQIHIERYRTTGRPSLPALAVHHAEQLGLDKNTPEYRAMILVAVRAEMKAAVTPPFHSKYHYTDVAAVTANLLEKNNEMVSSGEPRAAPLTRQEQALTFITAIGHDLDHDGHGNPKDNPTFNEQKSFEAMLPLLEEAGLSGASISKMHTILMTTSPNGPHAVLKAIAQAHRNGQAADLSKIDPQGKFAELHVLAHDKRLEQMAAILSDSDLYASSGAGLKSSATVSAFLSQETGMDLTTDAARKFFFDNIVGTEGYASAPGRAVAQESFEALRAENDRRLAAPPPKRPSP